MLFQVGSAAVIGLVATTVALAAARPVLLHNSVLDVPNHRSSHLAPTVRAGGIGIALGLLCALSYAGAVAPSGRSILYLFAAVLLAFALLGLAEDIHGLSVRVRLIGQGLLGAVFAVGLFYELSTFQLVVAVSLGVALTIFYVNAANFMDGVNSISALHGLVAGIYFSLIGIRGDIYGLGTVGTSVAFCFAMFLPWNAPRARMFMGDVGSYALGGAVSGLGLWSVSQGVPLFTAVAPLGIYALDVLRTLLLRWRRGKSLVVAHRDHIYQQLQRLFDSHAVASSVATLATLGWCVAGLAVLVWPKSLIPAACLAAALSAGYLASPTVVSKVTGKEITE